MWVSFSCETTSVSICTDFEQWRYPRYTKNMFLYNLSEMVYETTELGSYGACKNTDSVA